MKRLNILNRVFIEFYRIWHLVPQMLPRCLVPQIIHLFLHHFYEAFLKKAPQIGLDSMYNEINHKNDRPE
jgi:hypothetical protein